MTASMRNRSVDGTISMQVPWISSPMTRIVATVKNETCGTTTLKCTANIIEQGSGNTCALIFNVTGTYVFLSQ